MQKVKPAFFVVAALILAAAFSRLIPHWPNFTAVAAIALFGGARFRNKLIAFVIPLAALFLTDLILGLHSTMIPVYAAFGITVLLGMSLRNRTSALGVGTTAVAASVIFFLITNFGAWLTMPMYTKDAAGLMMAYLNGLAFFNDGAMGVSPFINTLLGDLFYTGVLFGSYALAGRKIPSLRTA
ncbi:MAG TPA: hypothetical protein P5228_12645 [Bacteroidales bacterium]|nr:hypothetical protein [Bacteroidales bacterium]HRZ47824.1 hypothetical protein [Bacteroidales bacterium]